MWHSLVFVVCQVDEIVYAKYDASTWWYLARILRVTQGHYDFFYMDGDTKDNVPLKDLHKVSGDVLDVAMAPCWMWR